MKNKIEITVDDLFDIPKKSRYEMLTDYIKKQKRTTSVMMSKDMNVPQKSSLDILKRMVDEGIAKDLGLHVVKGKTCRIFEAI